MTKAQLISAEDCNQIISEEVAIFAKTGEGVDQDTLVTAIDLRQQRRVIDNLLELLHRRAIVAHWPIGQEAPTYFPTGATHA